MGEGTHKDLRLRVGAGGLRRPNVYPGVLGCISKMLEPGVAGSQLCQRNSATSGSLLPRCVLIGPISSTPADPSPVAGQDRSRRSAPARRAAERACAGWVDATHPFRPLLRTRRLTTP